MGTVRRASGAALAFALVMGSASLVAAQGLPGGATSLNETHGDWTVACVAPEGAVRCAMTQAQVSGENRQRVLAIELAAAEAGNATNGVLVLPFGLRLDAGVRLAVDEAAALEPLRFSTCLPAGCVVPLTFDAAMVTVLKSATAVAVNVTASDNGQEMAFSISLAGFASALARLTELSAQ